jgi:tetratricopeptide (TPR) repeat protein
VPWPLLVLDEDLRGSTPGTVSTAGRSSRASSAAAFASGQRLYESGDWSGALARYQQAASADPVHLPTQARIILCHLHLRQEAEARTLALTSLKKHPRSPELLATAAVVHALSKSWTEASSTAEASRKIRPDILANYQVLAEVALAQDKPARIRELFRAAQAISSDIPVFHVRMAALWARLLPLDGKTSATAALREVQPMLARAEKLDPGNLALQIQSAFLAFAAGDYEQAVTRLEAIRKTRPHLTELREKLAYAYIQLGRPAEAIPLVRELIREFPQRHGLNLTLGELHTKANQWPQAADAYQVYSELGPQDVKTLFMLAEAQLNARRLDEALKTIRSAQRRHTSVPAFSYLRALVHHLQKDYTGALAAFDEAEQLAVPGYTAMLDREFYYRKGLTADLAGENAVMETAFRRCIELNPQDHEAMNHLGYSWAEKGQNLEEAQRLIQKALDLQPDHGAYLDSLAWVFYQKGEYKRARPWIEKAAARLPDDPVIHEHLGDIYAKLGLNEKAITAWNRALDCKSPNREAIESKIKQLKR